MAKWIGSNDIYTKRLPRTKTDFVNQRFGKLIATSAAGHDRHRGLMVICKCDCGVECAIRLAHLIDGRVKSCGCLKAGQGDGRKSRIGTQLHTAFIKMFPSSTKRLK